MLADGTEAGGEGVRCRTSVVPEVDGALDAVLVLAAPTIEDLPAVREVTEALMPLTEVLLGGAHRDRVEGPVRLGHHAGAAADALATRLGAVS